MGNFDIYEHFNLEINTDNLEGVQCSMDFIHFLKYVITTTYDGELKNIPIEWPYIAKLAHMLVHEKRLVILKGRQMLCSWVIVAYAVWACLNQENLIILIISKGENEAQEMVRRAYELYDRLPDFIRNMLPLKDGPRNKGQVEFENRGRIIALPSKGSAPRSVSAKIVFIDEAGYARELNEMLAAIEPALGDNSQLFIVSTPNGKMIGRPFTELCKNAEAKGYRRFDLHFRLCPPYRNPEWEKAKRKSMTPSEFAHEFELSLTTAGAGAIFGKEYDEKNEWEGKFNITDTHVLLRCIDPGDKLACIWIAEDVLGNIIAYREAYFHGFSNERRAKRIIALSLEEEYECSVMDSADPVTKREFAKHGIFCRACLKKDVYESIDELKLLFEGNGLDTPRLYITDDCPKLKEQIQCWVGDENGYPVKNQYDHGIDGLRYGVQLRMRLRINRGAGIDIEQVGQINDIDKEFELEISGDTLHGSGIDRDRDFQESDFDLGAGF